MPGIALIRRNGGRRAGLIAASVVRDIPSAPQYQRIKGKNVRILVTGGAGFLGSHLCDLLIRRGDTVVCLDDLSTGKRDNLKHLDDSARFSFIEACVLNALDIAGSFDGVVHL